MGLHEIEYAIYPHKGDIKKGKVLEEAYGFNYGLLWGKSATPTTQDAWKGAFEVKGNRGVIVETVKKGEEEQCNTVVIRMYEAYGGYEVVKVISRVWNVEKVETCDILERKLEGVDAVWEKRSDEEYGGVEVSFSPFQITTLKLYLK